MNNKQRELLKTLEETYQELAHGCEHDDDFHSLIIGHNRLLPF